jgi:phage-related protein
MAFKLADLFVELSAKGFDAFGKQLEDTKKEIDTLNKAIDSGAFAKFVKEQKALEAARRFADLRGEFGRVGAHLTLLGERVEKFQEKFEKISAAVVRPLQLATVAMAGFVAAGLRGTVQSEALAFHFERLARAVADIFAPAINQVIGAIESLANWFRGLSDRQKDLIAAFAITGAAIVVLAGVAVAAIVAVKIAVNALTAAFAALNVVSGGILIIIGAIITAGAALVALTASTEKGREALSKLWKAIQPIFEALGELFSLSVDLLTPLIDAIAGIAQVIADILVPQFKAWAAALRTIITGMERLGILRRQEEGQSKRARVEPGGGGFEKIEDTFRRVQLAGLKADIGTSAKSVEEKQLEAQQMANQKLDTIAERVGGLKPAVGR